MKNYIYLFVLALLLTSCDSNKIFSEYTDIDNFLWKRDHVITYEANIDDPDTVYDVYLALRHTTYYAWANIKVNCTVVYPGGEERTMDHDIMLRNEDGTFKAEGAGDLWDIEYRILEKASFKEKGTYVFKIQNIMPKRKRMTSCR